jgi:hypothetical protein
MRLFVLCACVVLSSCGAEPSKKPDERSVPLVTVTAKELNTDPSIVSEQQFKQSGKLWPLTVSQGEIGCATNSQWVRVDGVQYGLNGVSDGFGYEDITPIWKLDYPLIAKLSKSKNAIVRKLATETTLRVSLGDLSTAASKFC